MADYINPTTSTTGTEGDDTFAFTQPIVQPITVNGAGGHDRLFFDDGGFADKTFRIREANGQFHAETWTQSFESKLNYTGFEDLEMTGSVQDDLFDLRFTTGFGSTNVALHAGDGDDLGDELWLYFQGISDALTFTVAADGTVEAVSVKDSRGFAVGVQWHPEYWVKSDSASAKIFRAFGDAVRQHAATRAGVRTAAE